MPSTDECQWRILVEEVPTPPSAAAEDSERPLGVALRVRVSLPLLQRPKTARQDLEWTVQHASPGALRLTAQNLGNVTERLDEVQLGSVDDPSSRVVGPLYMFPGERRSFDLRPNATPPAGAIQLRLQGTPRPLTHELVLSAP